MITFTLRMDDLLLQGEFVDQPANDKKPFWRLAIADFHKGESQEVETNDEEMIAIIVLAMGVGENDYDGYWIKLLYARTQGIRNQLHPSLNPVP